MPFRRSSVAETLAWQTAIATNLRAVEDVIRGVIGELPKPGLDYIVESSGKRMRPALALLACDLTGSDVAKVIPAAAGVEFIHVATLVHDDVIDQSVTRRGKPSL